MHNTPGLTIKIAKGLPGFNPMILLSEPPVSALPHSNRVRLAGLWSVLTPHSRVLPTVYKVHKSRLLLMGNKPVGVIRKTKESGIPRTSQFMERWH
jgi:hypothetical protein